MRYFWLFLIFVFSGCIEEFVLEEDSKTSYLIVDGQISNEYKRHAVRLSWSGPLQTEDYLAASNAIVEIRTPDETYPLTEVQPGYYLTDSLAGIPLQTYTLHVEHQGKTYLATDQMPARPSPFEPITFREENGFYEFEYRRHQFGFDTPNQWELFIHRDTTQPLPEWADSSRLGLQVGVEVYADLTYQFTYFTHPNIEVAGLMNFDIPHFYGFSPGFTATLKKYALSAEYYAFLRAVFQETEWRGTLFSTVPANVEGNVDGDLVLGYFSAVAVEEIEF